jgi:hypothetical protein
MKQDILVVDMPIGKPVRIPAARRVLEVVEGGKPLRYELS